MADVTPDIRATDVVDRLRDALGCRTDIALGEYFGHGTSAVSGWRQRNRVPYAECVIAAMRKGVSLEWLLLGIGTATRRQSLQAVADGKASYGDPRVDRLLRFVQTFQASHDGDDMAWLERTIARAVPEYGEWLASQKD